jgi:hypothetical protein
MNYSDNSTTERKDNNRKYETIRQLARRHMMDQSHTTTDEELKNAMVELDNQVLVEYKSVRLMSETNQ